ncbi:uncharacterized protein LOC123037831 [Drosophila rhopaloa]|uniref:Uncharacterized protein n=1 Tax=Drosophila rhopaloa TaxID=1041015 RepID=A0ABM5JC78_DRORH|nr:uncharacterized protein LOC123037831 [Drosophila rhopaloa]
MDYRKDEGKEDESLSSSESQGQVIINIPPDVDHAQVVYLSDANLEATETEDPRNRNQEEYLKKTNLSSTQGKEMENSQVTFQLDDGPSTSAQSTKNRQKLEEIKYTLRRDLQSKSASVNQYGPNRMYNVLEILNRFSRNLDLIEARLTEEPAVILQVPQYCDLATQTAGVFSPPRRYRLDLTTLRTDTNRPPCERSHHTITISGNNLPPHPPQLRQTFCARIGRSISDFAGAFCLCLQVNKDCVFCLGFFVAFVISASFLTAFFYRTLSFTASPVRVAANPVSGTAHYELATLKFNGGYYYIYNSNQQKII